MHDYHVESETFITNALLRVIIFTWRRMAAKHHTRQPQDARKVDRIVLAPFFTTRKGRSIFS